MAVVLASASLAGPPPGPAARELAEVTDFSGLTASPDGRSVAFRTERASIGKNSYLLAWHVVDLETGIVREIAGGGEPIYADPGLVEAGEAFWSPDGSGLFHRALVDGAIGLWRTSTDGSGSTPVVLGDSDLETLELAPEGGALVYTLGPTRAEIERAEQREYDEGIFIDAHVDLAQNPFRGGSINGRMATQRLTGSWFSRSGLLWREMRRIGRLDLATLEDRAAGEKSAEPGADPPRHGYLTARSQRGDEARASANDGATSLVVQRQGGIETVACAAPICGSMRIVSLAWRPGSDELVITTRDQARHLSLHAWKVGAASVRFLGGGEGLLDSGARYSDRPCAITARQAVCVAAGAVSPPRLEAVDLDSGARQVLFDPNGALRARAMPATEQLSWRLPDGRTAHGILLLPQRREGRLPLFISYYRCEGYLRGGEGDEWPFAPLVDAGFAVACINALPPGAEQDALASYRGALAAIRALVGRLETRGIVDRSRIGMGGFSFGSEATMWVAMNSDLLAAASIASTQMEPAYYWFNAVKGRDQPDLLRKVWGLGRPEETAAQWRRVSPALNVRRIRSPLLLQLPEQEARLVVELYARLSRSSTPAELYAFPDEAHIVVQPRHRLAAYRRNIDWFRYWLQGYVDPDAEKAGQYERWNALARERGRRSAAP